MLGGYMFLRMPKLFPFLSQFATHAKILKEYDDADNNFHWMVLDSLSDR